MKIGTKALISLFIITMMTISVSGVAFATGTSAVRGNSSDKEKQLERLSKHHDRKMELRASVLGMSNDQLKDQLKDKSFKQILRDHGFKTKQAFNTAMLGKIKEELMRRGWDDKKINSFLQKKFQRHHN